MRRLVVALLIVATRSALAASGGSAITVQHTGYLLDVADAPLDGSFDLTFRIADASSNGTIEWAGTCTGVAVRKGYYAVVLGSSACTGTGGTGDSQLSTTDLPAAAPRYLEVVVGNILLTPRIALPPLPAASSAVRADTADKLGTLLPSDVALAGHTHVTATATQTGFLSSTDWSTFNAKLSTEVDPKIGTLSANKWCTSNGTIVQCTSDVPTAVAGTSSPVGCAPQTNGALWYDSPALKVCNGSTYVTVATVNGSGTPATDANFAQVTLLMHLEDLSDVKGASATNSGVVFSADARYTPRSAFFNGASFLSLPGNAGYAFGTGDFTVELWVQGTLMSVEGGAFRRIYMTDGPTGNAVGNFQIIVDTATGRLYAWDGGSTLDLVGSSRNVVDGGWHHVAVTRQSGSLRMFVDGAVEGTVAYATSIAPNGGTPRPTIGAYGSTSGRWAGRMADLRVTKGVARYTAAFTPPKAPFPDN